MFDQPWINTDPFLDIERLKSLELEIVEGICLADHNITNYGTGVHLACRPEHTRVQHHLMLQPLSDPHRAVYERLREAKKDDWLAQDRAMKLFTKLMYGVYTGGPTVPIRSAPKYIDKNYAAKTYDHKNAEFFPGLLDYIHTLPFTEIGRVLIFVNDHDLVTPLHTDHFQSASHRNEFLWLRTNLNKKFFICNPKTEAKSFVTSYSAFFNEQCWHGTDPSTLMTFAIRVDGFFTDEFREQIGLAGETNYAKLFPTP